MDGRTLNGKIHYKAGGVGRNLCEALGKLLPRTLKPRIISAVGDDEMGKFLLNSLVTNVDTSGVLVTNEFSTATACVLLDEHGSCPFVVASMDIHACMSISWIQKHEDVIRKCTIAVLDGNLSQKTMDYVLDVCLTNTIPVWYEPTDFRLADKPFRGAKGVSAVKYISPNFLELQTVAESLIGSKRSGICLEKSDGEEIVEEARRLAVKVAEIIPHVIVTLGKHGVLVSEKCTTTKNVTCVHHKSLTAPSVCNVSGAGDCFAAGYIAGILKNCPTDVCVQVGLSCALQSLESDSPVPAVLKPLSTFIL